MQQVVTSGHIQEALRERDPDRCWQRLECLTKSRPRERLARRLFRRTFHPPDRNHKRPRKRTGSQPSLHFPHRRCCSFRKPCTPKPRRDRKSPPLPIKFSAAALLIFSDQTPRYASLFLQCKSLKPRTYGRLMFRTGSDRLDLLNPRLSSLPTGFSNNRKLETDKRNTRNRISVKANRIESADAGCSNFKTTCII